MIRYIANHRRRIVHVLDNGDRPICGRQVNPKNHGFVERSDIVDFMPDEEISRRRRSFFAWRASYRMCKLCKRKM